MRNYYLLESALRVGSVAELERGLINLNSIILNRDQEHDNFIRNSSIWECDTTQGLVYEMFSGIVNDELKRVIPDLFRSFTEQDSIYINHNQMDNDYPNDCNGFTGFDFSLSIIPPDRQVVDIPTYNIFKQRCLESKAFVSIQSFWDNRNELFPSLILLDRVWNQIRHLSLADPRFKLIHAKLKRLNEFTQSWETGSFDIVGLGLDNSPDTPKRIKETLALRTFNCGLNGDKVFSLHIKWDFGAQPFRLYYYPNEPTKKVYVGYIGGKAEIGF
ncbi:MAG: hypothetical protein JZU53_05635 [Paludibacter sp.]|nr:hypothetical protein [Paludibacter sp.]